MARLLKLAGLYLVLVAASCGRTPGDEPGADALAASAANAHPRQPYFTPGSDNYDYYEGGPVQNSCTQDQSCLVTGCAGSTCAAEAMTIMDNGFCQSRSVAQMPEPQLATCGCFRGECRWYFENDYDRSCEVDADCAGLGPPLQGALAKGSWKCGGGSCRYVSL